MCLNPQSVPNKRRHKALLELIKLGLEPSEHLQGEPEFIDVPCGRCVECLNERSREWSFRVNEEKKHHIDCCAITLTYANTDGELCRRDWQLFMKRLRKHISPVKVRFFGCGEYGSKGKRPHFHACLFGYDFKDKTFWKKSKKGDLLFRSKELEKLWTLGFSTVELVTDRSAKYMSLYYQKLNDFEEKKVKPFLLYSNRPGIGFNSITESLIETDKLYMHGNYIKLPRYFLKVLERNGCDLEQLKDNRFERSQMFIDSLPTLEEQQKKVVKLQGYFCPNPRNSKPILTRQEKYLKKFTKNLIEDSKNT